MEAVPILIIVFLLMFGGSSAELNADGTRQVPQRTVTKNVVQTHTNHATYDKVRVKPSSYNANLEYKTILSYITKNIPESPDEKPNKLRRSWLIMVLNMS